MNEMAFSVFLLWFLLNNIQVGLNLTVVNLCAK